MSQEQRDKENKTIAALTTAGLQGVLFLILFLFVAWRPPNPPLPEYGVELNFGLDSEGFGDVQPDAPVGNNGDQPEQAKQEEPQPVKEEPKPVEKVEEAPKEETIKPIETREPEPELTSKDEESPVVVKEKPVEKKPEEKKPIEKPVEKPVEKIIEKKVDEKPKEAPKAVFKPRETPSTTQAPEGTADGKGDKQGKPGNHGDNRGTTGDKGNPEGKLDAKALYGQPGGGGGGVSMSGFNGFEWPKVQAPTLPEEAYGVYEFMVKVDDQGDVISVTPLQRGLSLEAERKLKAAIQQLVFTPKGANLPPQSEGKITFRVVSK